MPQHLAQEIVEAAHAMELESKTTRLVFATLTFFPNRYPNKWCVNMPDTPGVESHVNLPSALRSLAAGGFVVDVKDVNEWLRHTESKPGDKRSRIAFSKVKTGLI